MYSNGEGGFYFMGLTDDNITSIPKVGRYNSLYEDRYKGIFYRVFYRATVETIYVYIPLNSTYAEWILDFTEHMPDNLRLVEDKFYRAEGFELLILDYNGRTPITAIKRLIDSREESVIKNMTECLN